ncbi:alpha-(1,6)-fucosyltransferase-like [Clavelina lepadiformis]|uniref:GT23 domain-containing protein n=1 Tax=Clavelina lepadiformis TaxID=159417 RepID=A0ABP0F785_CLALP
MSAWKYLISSFFAICTIRLLTNIVTENAVKVLRYDYMKPVGSTAKSNKLISMGRELLKKFTPLKQSFAKEQEELAQLVLCIYRQTSNNATTNLDRCNVKDRVNFLLNGLENISTQVLSPDVDVLAEEVRKYTAQKIHELQNPTDCGRARLLECTLAVPCGYGGMTWHFVACINLGIALNRTVIFSGTRKPMKEYFSMFQPITASCNNITTSSCDKVLNISEGLALANETCLTYTMRMQLPSDIVNLAYSVPYDIFPLISAFNSKPYIWWNGQITSFVMRPKAWLNEFIENKRKRLLGRQPIVGVHIRRTDKHDKHPVSTYMIHVENWWQKYEQQQQLLGRNISSVRRVYVATDEPEVVPEVKQKYPNYNVSHNEEGTKHASTTDRWSSLGAQGLITDVYLLSKCDFVICGLTSNVCRLVFDLMQSIHTDASSRLFSVDKSYNAVLTEVKTKNRYIATMDHVAQPGSIELDMKRGDVLNINEPKRVYGKKKAFVPGYYSMNDVVNNKTGLVPSYKAKPFPRISPIPFL